MTMAELEAFGSVPRIAKELELISTLLRTLATIEYANTIDCTVYGAVRDGHSYSRRSARTSGSGHPQTRSDRAGTPVTQLRSRVRCSG